MVASSPYTSNGIFNIGPTSHVTVLEFWISLVWLDHHHKRRKTDLIGSGLLWEGYLCWFYFLLNHGDPNILRIKRIGQTHQWYGPVNKRSYSAHFPPRISSGLQCQQNSHTWIQPLWHSILLLLKWLAPLICKPVLLVYQSIGSNHRYNMIWTSLSYHCFSPPWIGWYISSYFLAHSELVHVYEGIFCE